jgi:hypothetical protein
MNISIKYRVNRRFENELICVKKLKLLAARNEKIAQKIGGVSP